MQVEVQLPVGKAVFGLVSGLDRKDGLAKSPRCSPGRSGGSGCDCILHVLHVACRHEDATGP
jgi:hypothetical protein